MHADPAIAAEWLYARPGAEPPARGVAITLDGDRIAAVETDANVGGRGRVALPALANAHDHGRCFRPLAYGISDQPLECWLAMLHHTPAVDLYTQSVVAFGRMALSGIAAVSQVHIPVGQDPVEEAEAVARAARDVGVRVGYAAPVIDTNAFVYGGPEALRGDHTPTDWETVRQWDGRPYTAVEQIEAVDAIAEACASSLFTVQYGPAGPQWVREDGWERLGERVAATGRRLHTHILETKTQRQWSDAHYPGGMLRWLDELGLVSPQLTIAHFIWPTDAEIELVAARGARVSVNSSSNLRLQSGIAPVTRFKQAGLDFACGLDGLAFNDDEDALFELRLLSKLHAQRGLDGPGITVAEVWRAATEVGRFTIDGTQNSGRIAPGADADLMIVDLDAIAPDAIKELADPLELIMTRARALHVTDLYVAGRQVVSDGRLTGVDLEAAERELNAIGAAAAPRLAPQMPLLRRHRDIVRTYYDNRRHLERRDG